MRVQVKKWGNSLALRIPKPFAEDVGVSEGMVVDVSVSKGRLVAAPLTSRPVRLAELLRHVTRQNRHGETATGPAMGHEAW
jgi:antitoxin MazE